MHRHFKLTIMQPQINLSPITQFVQQLKSAEFTNQREVKMPIQQARLLSIALVELMDQLRKDVTNTKSSSDNEVVKITMDGGGFNL